MRIQLLQVIERLLSTRPAVRFRTAEQLTLSVFLYSDTISVLTGGNIDAIIYIRSNNGGRNRKRQRKGQSDQTD